jgi:ankyrin repeat protein
VLLDTSADINLRNNDGLTPLMDAAHFTQTLDMINMLLILGADTALQEPLGQKAVDFTRENQALRGNDTLILAPKTVQPYCQN